MNTPARGPRLPDALQAGARRLSPAHVRRLRAIVAHAGNVHRAARLTKISPEIVHDALTDKIFRRKTADSLEARIDAVDLSSLRESEAPSTDPR